MKSKILIIFLLVIMFLSACTKPHSNTSSPSVPSEKKRTIIEETEYYKVAYVNLMYEYYIYDKEHNVVRSETSMNRQPHLSMVSDDTVKFTLQVGTGIGTQWGYFYNVTNNVFSPVYNSIYDQTNDKVAYGGVNKVIVSDIYDKEKYYYEIKEFKEPLSKTVQPIFCAEFIDDGNKLKVSYLSGDCYTALDQIFELKDNQGTVL